MKWKSQTCSWIAGLRLPDSALSSQCFKSTLLLCWSVCTHLNILFHHASPGWLCTAKTILNLFSLCLGALFNLNDFCALNYTMHFIAAGFFSSRDSCSLWRQLIDAVCIYFIIQAGLIRSVTDPSWAEAFCPWCAAGEFFLSAPPCGWEARDRWTRRGCPRIPCLCKGSVAEDFPDSLSAAQTQLSLEIWQKT